MKMPDNPFSIRNFERDIGNNIVQPYRKPCKKCSSKLTIYSINRKEHYFCYNCANWFLLGDIGGYDKDIKYFHLINSLFKGGDNNVIMPKM